LTMDSVKLMFLQNVAIHFSPDDSPPNPDTLLGFGRRDRKKPGPDKMSG